MSINNHCEDASLSWDDPRAEDSSAPAEEFNQEKALQTHGVAGPHFRVGKNHYCPIGESL